ncbi:MAG TPA: hypothetical protein VGC42_10995 [Kofleriaceae bacterium]
MSDRDERFRAAVLDGGALGAAAVHGVTREVLAGHQTEQVLSPAVLDLILGVTRPSGALTRACGGAPPSAARELFVAGAERATYLSILPHGEVILLATPTGMSVAVGWALVRGLAAGWSGA